MKKFLLAIIIVFFSIQTKGQNEEKLDSISKQLKDLKDLILENNNIEFGKIDFILNGISTSKFKNKTVDKIEFNVIDGCIVDIKVTIDNNIYTNPAAPIAITNNRLMNRSDFLYNDSDIADTLLLQDLIDQNSKFKPYTPENNDKVVIDKNSSSYILKKDISLNSLLDVRIMSDALALFSDEANGIVQTEVKSKFILSRGNIRNTGIIPLNYLNAKLNYNKIDSEIKTIDLLEYNSSEFLQKSIFKAEISINAFKFNFFNFKSKNKFYTDVGFNFSTNETQKEIQKSTITTYCFFVEGGINLKLYDELNLILSDRLIRLMSPETKGYNGNLNESFFNFNEIAFDLEYYLNKNKKTKLFLRLNYFRPINSLSISENQFTQVQVGYSKLFTDLF